MNKQEIITQLKKNHEAFTSMISNLPEEDFSFTEDGKWTAGQQAEHIVRAVKPVKLAFSLPIMVLRMLFGKANRPSRSYEQLVEKYKTKLAEGGKASGRFIPPTVNYNDKDAVCNKILSLNEALCKRINTYTEESLEAYVIPHPLLGKLTLREMLFFNMLHVEHHRNSVAMLLHKRALV